MDLNPLIPKFRALSYQDRVSLILRSLRSEQLLPEYLEKCTGLLRQHLPGVALNDLDLCAVDPRIRAIKAHGHCRSSSLVYFHLMGGRGDLAPLRRWACRADGVLVHFWLTDEYRLVDITRDQIPLLPDWFSYTLGKPCGITRAEAQGKYPIEYADQRRRLTEREWLLLQEVAKCL